MQDKAWATLTSHAHLPINIAFLPRLQAFWLSFRQVTTHGKLSVGKIQRRFVISHGIRLKKCNKKMNSILTEQSVKPHKIGQ